MNSNERMFSFFLAFKYWSAINTFNANHAISQDASALLMANYALSLKRHQVSIRNSIAPTAKRRLLFILATREGVKMAANHYLMFTFARVVAFGQGNEPTIWFSYSKYQRAWNLIFIYFEWCFPIWVTNNSKSLSAMPNRKKKCL